MLTGAGDGNFYAFKIDSCVRVLVVDDRCPDDKSQI